MQKHITKLVLLTTLLCTTVFGFSVNRLNGGMSIVYVDFSLTGSTIPLELLRSYNSITSVTEANGWLGSFGWGWTSPFETTLTTTPERHVLLRDGATGNTIVFKPEKEDTKARGEFIGKVKAAYFEKQKGRELSDKELAKLNLPSEMSARLKTEPGYRIEIASKYGITAAVPRADLMVSTEYGYQTIRFKNGKYIRERDPYTQIFDNDGRLIRQVDKSGYAFNFKYSPTQKSQLTEIVSEDRSSSLRFTYRQDRIVEVVDNKNRRARYFYDGNANLVQSVDSNHQTYNFKYENKKFPHLLTRIEYATESTLQKQVFREIKYDDNGLVVYHKDKDGTETQYSYGKIAQENHFWTKMITKANGKSEEQYDEYLIKLRADGTKYLYRQENKLNGVSTVFIYNQCCGKPLQIVKNGEVTAFKYFENGALKERTSPKEDVKLEYDPKWNKISKVIQNKFISEYKYDSKGNLIHAKNSNGANLSLTYDRFGRILEMTDPEGKKISFKYNDQGKPVTIAEKGVGTIRIDYEADGRIRKAETIASDGSNRKPSEAKSQDVIRQVMKGFQHLLDIIRPAGVSYTG